MCTVRRDESKRDRKAIVMHNIWSFLEQKKIVTNIKYLHTVTLPYIIEPHNTPIIPDTFTVFCVKSIKFPTKLCTGQLSNKLEVLLLYVCEHVN